MFRLLANRTCWWNILRWLIAHLGVGAICGVCHNENNIWQYSLVRLSCYSRLFLKLTWHIFDPDWESVLTTIFTLGIKKYVEAFFASCSVLLASLQRVVSYLVIQINAFSKKSINVVEVFKSEVNVCIRVS